MLNVHLGATDFLSSLAVFTAIMRSRRDLIACGSGDRLHGVELDPTEKGFSPAQTEQRVGACFAEGYTAIFLA
jgi:hypothetical protein